MITRNILDTLGNIIGTMDFPDGTSENTISNTLAPYAAPAVSSPIYSLSVPSRTQKASGNVTTSSSTAATVLGMTDTPPAGKYIALFSGSIYTAGASAVGEFGFYVDGALIQETRRDISCNLTLLGGLVTVSLNAIGVGTYSGTEVDLNGSQTIDIRFRSTNGGTIGFSDRCMTLLRVK